MQADRPRTEAPGPGLIDVVAVDAALGAEVRCGDIRRLDERQLAEVRQAFLDHLVVLFRGQDLSPEELVAFGRRFGALQRSNPLPDPRARTGEVAQGGRDERWPEVTVVSNIVDNGVALGGLGDGELFWHSDMSSFEAPPAQTILHGIEIPPEGGETGFVNMYAALDALPQELRARAEALSLKHDASIDAAGYARKGFEQQTDPRASPGRIHPLVRTHPQTGHDCLYLGRRTNAYLAGLPLDESEALLDRLWAIATDARFTWHHCWQPGDVLMWDNRCTMHRRNPFDPRARRLLKRVVVQGSPPARMPSTRSGHPRAARQ